MFSRLFVRQFQSLVRMRAWLFWARIRNSRAHALFLVLAIAALVYLVYGSTVSGVGVALASVRDSRHPGFAVFFLAFIYLFGIVLQFVMGRGVHALFADPVLRAYPMTPAQRLVLRGGTWILDPIWLLLGLLLASASVTFCFLGISVVWFALPAAALLLLCTWLTASLMVALAERALSSVSGTSLLAAAVIFVLSLVSIASLRGFPIVDSIARLSVLPPGASALLLFSRSAADAAVPLITLLGWVLSLAGVVLLAERKGVATSAKAGSGLSWVSKLLLSVSGRPGWTLAVKALAYNLRCDRIRLSLAVAGPVLIYYGIRMGGKQGGEAAPYCVAGAFFAVGFAATRSMLLNQFGYDGPALVRYVYLPVFFGAPLQSGSLVSLGLSVAVTAPALVIAAAFDPVHFTPRYIVVLILCAIAGSLFFNGLGLFTSVFAPRRVEFRRLIGNDMSVGGNLTMYAGLILALGVPLWVSTVLPFAAALANWPVFILLDALCAIWYAYSLRTANRLAGLHRGRLLESLGI
jgi:hypothetical protein